jgi:hypothetical protein
MNLRIRSILALSILVIVLAACGTTVGAPASETPTPSEPATPTAEPTVAPTEAPSEAPAETPAPADEERDVAGTITVAEGMTFSGPGATIQEALDNGPSDEFPTLVNGVIFRDTDGTIYLATAVSDTAAPTFEGPMLEVLNAPNDGPSWDMANAELLGLEEANGIVFNQDVQVLGFLEIR